MRVLPAALVLSGLILTSGSLFASAAHGHRASAHPVVAHAVSRSSRHAVTRAALHSSRSTRSSSVSHVVVAHHSNAVLMNGDRATQIQSALIKAGYLSGEPTGVWDSESTAAMQKLQGDNGWQTKLVPDSRALIKLGLGPGSAPAESAANANATASEGALD